MMIKMNQQSDALAFHICLRTRGVEYIKETINTPLNVPPILCKLKTRLRNICNSVGVKNFFQFEMRLTVILTCVESPSQSHGVIFQKTVTLKSKQSFFELFQCWCFQNKFIVNYNRINPSIASKFLIVITQYLLQRRPGLAILR